MASHEILRQEIEPERRTNVRRKGEKIKSADSIRRALLPPCPRSLRAGGALSPFPPCSGVSAY